MDKFLNLIIKVLIFFLISLIVMILLNGKISYKNIIALTLTFAVTLIIYYLLKRFITK